LFGALLIIENSEHPLRYYRKGFFRKIIGELKLFIELKTLDGILLITRSLVEFYKTRLGGDSRILLVPSTVDPTRFKKPKTNNPDFKYIGYFGSVNFDRDNVDLLINSFADIHEKHSDLHLVLGGMYATAEEKLIKDLVKQRGIESKVHLLRYLSREEIVQYLINSHILVLVRSDDPDTNASFPCKLTEFLATGNPCNSS
jgi:glycosyltransferase involved in cell wall biosynthesis